MTCTQITRLLWIKENVMKIMLNMYLGIYCQGQTKLSIISLKGLTMIETQKQKYYQDTSFRTLPRITITW